MSEATSSSTKFRVSDQEPERFKNFTETKTSIASQSTLFNQNHCAEVLMESLCSPRVQASDNGFVRAVIKCYNEHHNLVVRPDDIWIAILTQFSFYINKNAEEFRSKFVNFDGKEELSVTIRRSLRAAPHDLFVRKMTAQINKNLVDKSVKEWIQPNFSTTTTVDIVSCGIVFMATTKKYFHFKERQACGIPYVTLEGTVADWENIRNRLEKLRDYKLDKWYELLRPILDEFVAAKNNKPNIEFWTHICNHSKRPSGPTYISGWLTAFAVFDVEGNWTDHSNHRNKGPWPFIEMVKIPSGIVSVDVKIVEDSNEYESIMLAGHTGFEVLQDDCTLKPQIGWSIALKSSADEIDKLHDTARGERMFYCNKCSFKLIDLSSIGIPGSTAAD